MLIGPVFSREVTIVPRRARTFASRIIYGTVLVVLISTAWLLLTGTHWIRDVGDFSRFGATLFQILAPLQLALAAFFAAVLTAGAVAQEKDRRTLVLLLLTNLSNSELVVGKLAASILNVLVLLAVSLPVFMLCALFGGVSFAQIARVYLVTVVTVTAAGSAGSLIALWREKTFQALAMTVLLLVLWIAVWEIVALGILGRSWAGLSTETIAIALSPWQAIRAATLPTIEHLPGGIGASLFGMLRAVFLPIGTFLTAGIGLTLLLNAVAIARVRAWNAVGNVRIEQSADEAVASPRAASRGAAVVDQAISKESIWGVEYDIKRQEEAALEQQDAREAASTAPDAQRADGSLSAEPQATRHVWDNPIIWREIRTRAYGRKTLIIRLIYLVLFTFSAWGCHLAVSAPGGFVDPLSLAGAIVPLLFLSLVLVNAQAVTSLTSERDGKAFDLLLASDLTPKEFVYGKLGGVFYNAKEMIALPMALCFYLWWTGALSGLNLFYLVGGMAVLYIFVAMVGVHTGMHYANTRTAVGTSLGTVFFLFAGIATCMWMMVAFSGSFQAQLQPFLAFMLGGGVGLYVGLGARNPSKAIGLASFLMPLATFYAVTSLLLGQPHLVFVATVAAYGFTTVAMLIPAIDEFDVATGRTTVSE